MIWQVLTWRRPRRGEHRDRLLSGKRSLAQGWACCWEDVGGNRPSDIVFLENKHFQRPWWALSLNKANFAGGGGGALFLLTTTMFQWLLWFGLEQCIWKVNRKMDSWAGSKNSLENGDLLIFLAVLSCSLTIWTVSNHPPQRGTACLSGICTVWVTCPCLSIDWSECKEDKYLFLSVVCLFLS